MKVTKSIIRAVLLFYLLLVPQIPDTKISLVRGAFAQEQNRQEAIRKNVLEQEEMLLFKKYYDKAIVHYRKGEHREAIGALEKMLAIEPASSRLKDFYGPRAKKLLKELYREKAKAQKLAVKEVKGISQLDRQLASLKEALTLAKNDSSRLQAENQLFSKKLNEAEEKLENFSYVSAQLEEGKTRLAELRAQLVETVNSKAFLEGELKKLKSSSEQRAAKLSSDNEALLSQFNESKQSLNESNNLNSRLKAENFLLKAKSAQAKRSLKENISRLTRSLKEKTEQLEKIKESLTKAKDNLTRLEDERALLMPRLARGLEDNAELKKELKLKTEDLNQAAARLNEFDKTRASLAKAESRCSSLEKKLNQTRVDLEGELNRVKDLLAEKETQIASFQGGLESLQVTNAELKKEIARTQKQASRAKEKLIQLTTLGTGLKDELNQTKDKLTRTSEDLIKLEQENRSLNAEKLTLAVKLNEKASLLADTQKQLISAEDALKSLKLTNFQLKAGLSQLNKESASREASLEERLTQVGFHLEESLKEKELVDTELASACSQKDLLEDRVAQLTEELKAVQGEAQNDKENKKQLKRQLQESEAKNALLEKNLDETVTRLNQADKNNEFLNQKVADIQFQKDLVNETLGKVISKLKEANTKNTALEKRILKLTECIEEKEKDNDKN